MGGKNSLLKTELVSKHLLDVEPLDNDLRKVMAWLGDRRDLWFRKEVLVVGCLEEPISNVLALEGANVTGVDVREYGRGDFSSGSEIALYNHVVADFTEWHTDKRFDLIVAVSSIEHFGLGYYKDLVDESGDIKAVLKMESLLKDNGKIILTVPFSNAPQVTRHWRSYSHDGINRLIGDLSISLKDYFFTGYTGQHDATDEDVRCWKGGADLSIMLVLTKRANEKSKSRA